MIDKQPKTKTCKAKSSDGIRCNQKFTPRSPWAVACSPECSQRIVEADNAKKASKEARRQAKETRAAKLAIKSRADWMKEAQVAWNAFRRTEDGINRGGKCISCGTTSGKQNCGHYRAVGSNPSLRFEPLNTWLQCERCNTHLHSNAIEFRIALTKILTPDQLSWLEGSHPAKHYSIADLQEIIKTSRAKLRELEKCR